MDESILPILYYVSIVLSILLLFVSTAILGRQVGDLEYQIAAKTNGIRRTQSWVNIRTHSNRIVMAIAFLATAIIGLADLFYPYGPWIGRSLFILVIIVFTISSIMDWIAENKQVSMLMKYNETNNVSGLRVKIHALNGKLQIWYGLQEVDWQNQDTKENDPKMVIANEALAALKDLQSCYSRDGPIIQE
jgi:hypothetical protein